MKMNNVLKLGLLISSAIFAMEEGIRLSVKTSQQCAQERASIVRARLLGKQQKDLYQLLGTMPGGNIEQAYGVFLEKAFQTGAGKIADDIQEAYDILIDPKMSSIYELYLVKMQSRAGTQE